MLTMDFILKDCNGRELHNNDIIQTTLPEWENSYYDDIHDEDHYSYKPQRIVQGTIKLLLSKGIRLKITKILEDPEKDFHIGKEIIFKFKKWKWEIITE